MSNFTDFFPAASGGGGISWQTTPKTANFTAVSGEEYFVNTTSDEITVTLPNSPTAGDEVSLVDYAGTAATNTIKMTSSDNINGESGDVSINYERGGVSMVYVDSTQGWVAYNAANEANTSLAPPPFSVDYLIVAGGGAGGNGMGGGGGAGGLIHNYGGSGLALTEQTNYVVTIGSGAAGTTSNVRVNGSNSVFNTLTAIGGGGGSSLQMQRSANILDGNPGGSGGGSGASDPGDGYGGAGTQSTSASGGFGNAGGNNLGNNQGTYPGAGGGGAGSAGASGTSSSQSIGGAGGAGLQVNIDGNNYYWAAGGGGDIYSGTNVQGGPGGIGGGGAGSARPGGSAGVGGGSAINNGENGFVGDGVRGGHAGNNTGSGGGGASWTNAAGGNGGSGIVILRYPSDYTITNPGSGLTFTTDNSTIANTKITTFTAGTGNIQFS